MPRESVGNTLKVALILCVVCSIVVASAAVGLRSYQEANRKRELRRNILVAAGLYEEGVDVERVFSERVEPKIIKLSGGAYTDKVAVATYDQKKAVTDPELSKPLPLDVEDVAQIKRQETYSFVYLVKKADGSLDQVVLPIRGYGLWSTLWGFIALDADGLKSGPEQVMTRGLTYYDQKETPGLGGEVDNPLWKAKWSNPEKPKHVYDENWNVQLQVIKGIVSETDPAVQYKVDGLAGATITTQGVSNMLKFWLGEHGFLPYLKNLQTELQGTGGGNG